MVHLGVTQGVVGRMGGEGGRNWSQVKVVLLNWPLRQILNPAGLFEEAYEMHLRTVYSRDSCPLSFKQGAVNIARFILLRCACKIEEWVLGTSQPAPSEKALVSMEYVPVAGVMHSRFAPAQR